MIECCCRLSNTHYGCVGPISLRGEWITHDKYSYIASLSLQVTLPIFYKTRFYSYIEWPGPCMYISPMFMHATLSRVIFATRSVKSTFFVVSALSVVMSLRQSIASTTCRIYYEKSSSVTETVTITPMQYDRLLPRSTQNKQFILYKHIHGFTENIYPKSIIRKLI